MQRHAALVLIFSISQQPKKLLRQGDGRKRDGHRHAQGRKKCGDHQLGTIQQHDEGGAQRGIPRQNRQEHAAARTRRGKGARIDRG